MTQRLGREQLWIEIGDLRKPEMGGLANPDRTQRQFRVGPTAEGSEKHDDVRFTEKADVTR
jgi:hypothetical protein